jgi:hypothetical protein
MGKLHIRGGTRSLFLTLLVLPVVFWLEWPGKADRSPDTEPLAQAGFSVVAPTRAPARAAAPTAHTRLAALTRGNSDVEVGLAREETRAEPPATFAERFAAVFSFYRYDDEATVSADAAAMPPLEVMPDEPDEPAASPPRELRIAVYDIAGHAVYLPSGQRLEAHSGLGRNFDNPRFVHVKNRGPTPPGSYDLVLRKGIFHGVRAIRLVPVDENRMFGRDGMLAHSYMLGGKGQSNGCVVFRDYPAFLHAFERGEVNRLVVVDRLEDAPPELRRNRSTASLSHHAKRKLKRERVASQ